jgi:hypothetical protein
MSPLYTREQVYELCNRIEHFNAGAIDRQLSKYIREQHTYWLENTTPIRLGFFAWLKHRFGR